MRYKKNSYTTRSREIWGRYWDKKAEERKKMFADTPVKK